MPGRPLRRARLLAQQIEGEGNGRLRGEDKAVLVSVGVDPEQCKTRSERLKVFADPGVRKKLVTIQSDLQKQRNPIIARLVRIALYGDPKDAISAATALARIGGWNQDKLNVKHEGNINTTSVHAIISNPGQLDQLREALAQLDHEPGEASVTTYEQQPELPA